MTNFTPVKLVPTKYATVSDKKRFIKQFQKFVESDFAASEFPKWFYTRLSMTFGFIAHFSQQGFYHYYFSTDKGKVEFLRHIKTCRIYGDPEYTYSDVEKILQDWVKNT